VWGPKSAAAFKKLTTRLVMDKRNMASDLPTWIRFLQLTAIQGLRIQ